MEGGSSLGKIAGEVFRIGNLGSLKDVMVLSGIATAEMAFVDSIFPVTFGSGVSEAEEYYRKSVKTRRA